MPIILDLPQLTPINATQFLAMLVFVALDVVFGLCKAFATHSFDSTKMRQGLWHKCAIIGVDLMAYVMELVTQFMDFSSVGLEDFSVPIVGAVTGYIILMELGSILESLCVMNPELAGGKLLSHFSKFRIDDEQK